MAVDSREKRNSAISLLVPIFVPGIDPSSIDQAERQASTLVYSGILAEGAGAVSVVIRRPVDLRTQRKRRLTNSGLKPRRFR